MKLKLCALAGLTLLVASDIRGQISTSDPNIPPVVSPTGNDGYSHTGAPQPTYVASGVTVNFNSLLVRPIAVTSHTPSGLNEIESFDTNFSASGDVNIPGTGFFPNLPSSGIGPAVFVAFNKVGNTTGTFSTEMLSMDLSGTSALGPFMLRESPTLVSPGSTTVTDIGGGLYRIDSFFDVFTELSVDGGQTWGPDQNGPVRLTLVPEPASAAIAAFCAIGMTLRRRRHVC